MKAYKEKDRPSATAVEIYNNSGAMVAGTLVYINGFNTTHYCPTVGLADGADATKPAQLVILDPIRSGQKGWADTVALITKPDTSARAVGDTAYLSVTVPGAIQWAAPSAAGHQVQPVGVCVKVATIGAVYFTPGISFETQLGSTGIPDGSVTNAKLAATAVTEAVTVAKTFTHASLSDTAGILGTQISSSAGLAGSQLGVGTLHQVKTAIGHANATPTIAVLPAGSLLVEAWTVCTQTYDATAPTVDIGYAGGGNSDKILPTASIGKTSGNVSGDDPAVRGTDLYVAGVSATPSQAGADPFNVTAWPTPTTWAHPKSKFYASSTTVIATIAGASGNTTGTMDVYLSYIQTA